MDKRFIEIPKEYDTIVKKLQFLEEESIIEQKRDRMDMDYSFRLSITITSYKRLLSHVKQEKSENE